MPGPAPRSYRVPPQGELLERDAELGVLDAALSAARDGRGSLVTLSAAAGLGKSSLLAAVARQAGAAGVEALTARGSTLQAAVPFAVVRELLEGALRHRDPAARSVLLSGAARPAAGVLDGGSTSDASTALLGLYWLITNLTDERPMALLVDDLQWTDPGSVDLLEFLAPRAGDLPLLLVVASRPEAAPGPLARVAAAASERLELAPLTRSGTDALLCAALGRAVPADVTAACHEATGGNPFYTGELVHELAAQRIAPEAAGADEIRSLGPSAVARATLVRLMRVSDDAVTVARTIAILGDGVAERHVVAHSGLDAPRVAAALSALVHEAVLADDHPLRFAHPIVRAAITSDMTMVERAAQHARAASVLDADGAPAEQVAAHLLEAQPGASGTWAADRLCEAATAARGRGAPGVAADLLLRALAEPGAGDRHEIHTLLGTVASEAGRPEAVDHLRAGLAAAPDAPSRARAVLALAVPLAGTGAVAEAVALLRSALREVPDGPLADELVAELAAHASVAPAVTAEVMRGLEDRADDVPTTAAGRRTLASIAHWLATQGSPAGRVGDLAERALAGGRMADESGPGSPSFLFAAFLLITADRFVEARAELDGALELARRRGSVSGVMLVSMVRSLLAFREGALDEAVADAQLATDVAEEHGWGTGMPAAVGFLVDALIEQGRLDDAVAAMARGGMGHDVPDTVLGHAALVARGRLAIARHQLPAAVEHLEQLARQASADDGSWIVGTPTHRTYLAPALLALGDTDRAAALAAEEVALARAWGAPRSIGTALRVQGVVAGRDGGVALLEEAVAVLAPTAARLEHARALADLGATLRRAGQASAAREPLVAAIDLAERCGAAPLVAFAQDELVATGARRRRQPLTTGVAALTPSERRITELAADGLSNGEIAQTLFLSRKTIEMHLGNAYRKLDIHSRGQLPGVLGRTQGGPP